MFKCDAYQQCPNPKGDEHGHNCHYTTKVPFYGLTLIYVFSLLIVYIIITFVLFKFVSESSKVKVMTIAVVIASLAVIGGIFGCAFGHDTNALAFSIGLLTTSFLFSVLYIWVRFAKPSWFMDN